MHKQLNQEEERQFRQWARDNYKPYSPISGVWHPVVQAECVKINMEQDEKIRLSLGGSRMIRITISGVVDENSESAREILEQEGIEVITSVNDPVEAFELLMEGSESERKVVIERL